MAYNIKELTKKSLKVIQENNLMFIEHVCAYIGINKTTFYKHKLNENNEIKNAIENNKIQTKLKLLSNWEKAKEPVLQIALYKLIGTEEEYMRLANAKREINVPQLKNFDNINVNISKSNPK